MGCILRAEFQLHFCSLFQAVLSFAHPHYTVCQPGLANWKSFSSISLMYFLGDSVFLEAKSIQVFRRPLVAYSFRGSFLRSLVCEARKIYRRAGKQKGLPTCWLMPLTINSKAWSLTSVSRNLAFKAWDTFTQNTLNVQRRTIGSHACWCFTCF